MNTILLPDGSAVQIDTLWPIRPVRPNDQAGTDGEQRQRQDLAHRDYAAEQIAELSIGHANELHEDAGDAVALSLIHI